MAALLDNIRKLDARDAAQPGGHTFKHFVFSEVKQGGYGTKIITAALLADGFHLAFDPKLRLLNDEELRRTAGRNVALLP